jgi:hypothetical protein
MAISMQNKKVEADSKIENLQTDLHRLNEELSVSTVEKLI